MFRSSADHYQGVYLFLVKNHLIKIPVFIRGVVVMGQHNMHLFDVVSGVERHADPERPGTLCTGGCVGPRAGLDRCGKSRPQRDSIPGPSRP
jgi:hypothetical protein